MEPRIRDLITKYGLNIYETVELDNHSKQEIELFYTLAKSCSSRFVLSNLKELRKLDDEKIDWFLYHCYGAYAPSQLSNMLRALQKYELAMLASYDHLNEFFRTKLLTGKLGLARAEALAKVPVNQQYIFEDQLKKGTSIDFTDKVEQYLKLPTINFTVVEMIGQFYEEHDNDHKSQVIAFITQGVIND